MKHVVEHYGRVLSWLVKIEIMASVTALAVICVLTLVAVGMRQAGGSLLWSEEVSLLMMKVVVFMGAAGIYARRAYIVVGGLVATFPRRLRYAVSLAGWVLIGGFAALVAYQGVGTYPTQIAVRSYLLELPKFYFTAPLIVGTASICLVSIYFVLATIVAGPSQDGDGDEPDAHVPGLPGLGDSA